MRYCSNYATSCGSKGVNVVEKKLDFHKVKQTLQELRVAHNELSILKEEQRRLINDGLDFSASNLKIKLSTINKYSLLADDREKFNDKYGSNYIELSNEERAVENEVIRKSRVNNLKLSKIAEAITAFSGKFEKLEETMHEQLQEVLKSTLPNEFNVTLLNKDGIVAQKDLSLDEICDIIVDEETQLVHHERLKEKLKDT